MERKAEICVDGSWMPVEFSCLRKNDKFKLIEPDGTLVKNNEGETEFIAASDAYKTPVDDVVDTLIVQMIK